MGTDIHPVVQVRQGSQWINVTAGMTFERDRYENGEVVGKEAITEPSWSYPHPLRWRNYNLFAVLAGVRNGRGFAGVITGQPYTPIAEPRGLPDGFFPPINDAQEYRTHEWCDEGCTKIHYVWMGDHDFSWLTLHEIEEYPLWESPRKGTGIIGVDQYEAWDKTLNGLKYLWISGDVSGPNVVIIGAEQYDMLNDAQKAELKALHNLHIRIVWEETVAYSVGMEFFTQVLPWLRDLIPEGGTDDDVRIVFGFDS